ncbi:MAG: GTPase [Candidatus Bathyarchaeia archaeon]
MVTNLPPQCAGLEKRFREAKTLPEKITALEEYIAAIPKHKGTEKLLQQLKTRRAKLIAQLESEKKKGPESSSGKYAIRKEGAAQVVIIGPTGVGKSTLLTALTNAKPQITGRPFTTTEPIPGMMQFEDIQIQLVEAPALMLDVSWKPRVLSLARNSDGLILMVDLSDDPLAQLDMLISELRAAHIEVVERGKKVEVQGRESGGIQIIPFSGFSGNTEEIREALRTCGIHHALVKVWGNVDAEDVHSFLERPMLHKPALVVANKAELAGSLDKFPEFMRAFPELKITAVSLREGGNVTNIPRLVFESLEIMRVYTKRIGQEVSSRPIIVKKGSTVLDVAKIIHRELYEGFKFARVWGSSKYGGEKVGGGFELHDRDIVEIHI